MPAIVVVGAHWGDEGKGKIVDMVARQASMVVRYAGGDNAGHTVINDHGKFGLHLVPSGIFTKGVTCVIANGVAVNLESLSKEVESLEKSGIAMSRLRISDKAHVVLPYHIQLDGLEEKARGDEAIGTTKRGIGPMYQDKVGRIGIRVGDLLDADQLASRLGQAVEAKNTQLRHFGEKPVSYEALYSWCRTLGRRLEKYICPTEDLINDALDKGKTVIFEGAQGALLDVEFGTYPFVTSSSTIAAGVYPGAGLRPRAIECVLGIFKAYTTRVGTGPFPTELLDATGNRIRERAHEFGTTTGRPRRCGWFDAVAGKYSARVNGMTAGAITRLDVLDDFTSVKVCVGYTMEGKKVPHFPANQHHLRLCKPVYEELPGWMEPTSHLREFKKLPKNAKAYVKRLEALVGVPMKLISIGPRREETIEVAPLVTVKGKRKLR